MEVETLRDLVGSEQVKCFCTTLNDFDEFIINNASIMLCSHIMNKDKFSLVSHYRCLMRQSTGSHICSTVSDIFFIYSITQVTQVHFFLSIRFERNFYVPGRKFYCQFLVLTTGFCSTNCFHAGVGICLMLALYILSCSTVFFLFII